MGSGLRIEAHRCLSRQNAGKTMSVLHHALCGDDFHETPVSIKVRGKCSKGFFFFWLCGRCNIGEKRKAWNPRMAPNFSPIREINIAYVVVTTSCLWYQYNSYGGGGDIKAWRTGLVLALPGSTYSCKANSLVQLKGLGWPPRVRDTAQSYLSLGQWALLELMEPYGLITLCLLLHLLSPFVFRVCLTTSYFITDGFAITSDSVIIARG